MFRYIPSLEPSNRSTETSAKADVHVPLHARQVALPPACAAGPTNIIIVIVIDVNENISEYNLIYCADITY